MLVEECPKPHKTASLTLIVITILFFLFYFICYTSAVDEKSFVLVKEKERVASSRHSREMVQYLHATIENVSFSHFHFSSFHFCVFEYSFRLIVMKCNAGLLRIFFSIFLLCRSSPSVALADDIIVTCVCIKSIAI